MTPTIRRTASFTVFLVLTTSLAQPDAVQGRAPIPPSKYPQIYSLIYIPKQTDEKEGTRFRDQQAKRIISRFILSMALQDCPEIAKLAALRHQGSAREWLSEHVRVGVLEETGGIRVWVDAGSPREQAIIVNAVTKAYFKEEVDRYRSRCEADILMFEQQKEKGMLIQMRKAELKKWSGIQLLEEPETKDEK